ncbi:glycosyltransferase [Nocardiopsis listeri]|uniref:glycosyltransferase n=1 Tax=Nocardiopsis listeri TaxID=53440 RepID=UPI00082C5640|nr:glycosyltransferase family 2 protein [Nocardiopsis listeri]
MKVEVLDEALKGRGPGRLMLCHIGRGSTPAPSRSVTGIEVVDLPRVTGLSFGATVERVVLLAATTADLRAAIPLSGGLPSAAEVRIVVMTSAPHIGPPFPVVPGSGQWEGLLDFQVGRLADRGWSCAFAFTDPVEIQVVLRAVAQGMLGGRRDRRVPVPEGLDGAPDTGPTWEELGRSGALVGRVVGPGVSVDAVPAVDERVVNPMGFVRSAKPKVGRLVSRGGRWVLAVGDRVRWRVPEDGAVTDVVVAGLRDLRAVRVEWGRHSGPVAAVRAVVGLAAAGVPLVGARPPMWAWPLGEELHALLGRASEEGFVDELLREEHSVRWRRVALRVYGRQARWYRSGGEPVEPSVSVVLCTRRPEMVGFALRQVARQRGVGVEVVLALHGFGAGTSGVREAIETYRRSGRPLVVWEPDSEMVFGSVLNGAIARASGSLVAKMDDDDWYGPDHLWDLVAARRYSGADLVGCAAEYHHLEQLDLTVRRPVRSECFARHVTGAAMLTDRTVLEEVGGFRPWKVDEDAGLLDDVRVMGGAIYRTHGLGCVIRRRPAGHTWREDPGYFLRGAHRQWRGWRPSVLLEPDLMDAPVRAPGESPLDMTTSGSRR